MSRFLSATCALRRSVLALALGLASLSSASAATWVYVFETVDMP